MDLMVERRIRIVRKLAKPRVCWIYQTQDFVGQGGAWQAAKIKGGGVESPGPGAPVSTVKR